MIRNEPLGRRRLLRGALVGGASAIVPLPRLGAMLNGNGTAYADGTAMEPCFGTWFFGNGVLPAQWVPQSQGVGAAWQPSAQLAPLTPYKRALTVVTGMHNKIGAQHRPGSVLTGAPIKNDGVTLPTIDQVIAKVIGGSTRWPSLELGVSAADPDRRGLIFQSISHAGPNAPKLPEFDPRKVFLSLFSDVPTNALSRVTDAVRAQAADLRVRLGHADRQLLEQHMQRIDEIERRVGGGQGGTCKYPVGTAARYPTTVLDKRMDAPRALNDAMADLTTLALACNLTRVFSLMHSFPGGHVYFREAGIDQDFHLLCHGEADTAGFQPKVHKALVYTMESFAYLLGKLDAVKEGGSTLLDRVCIYVTSCVSWGKTHSQTEYPLLVAGRAAGALKGDIHYRAEGDNPSKLLFTLANLMGARITEIGTGGGRVTDGIGAILA